MKRILCLMLVLSLLTCACGKRTIRSEAPGESLPTTASSEAELPAESTEIAPQPPLEETEAVESQEVTDTEEIEVTAPTEPVPGLRTMDNLLRTAVTPLGSTMYIWGGGWNEADTGAGIEAVSFGLGEEWADFAARQGADYDHNQHRYEIHKGLDCSGYIGWLVYNVLETKPNREGYVTSSTKQARLLADMGYGSFYGKDEAKHYTCGDIVSMDGHVWLSLGTCADGSVLLLHASPPGVKLSGTRHSDGSKSDAVRLSEDFMQTYYPDWYERYPDCGVSSGYLQNNTMVRFGEGVFEDAEEYRAMQPEEVLEILKGE